MRSSALQLPAANVPMLPLWVIDRISVRMFPNVPHLAKDRQSFVKLSYGIRDGCLNGRYAWCKLSRAPQPTKGNDQKLEISPFTTEEALIFRLRTSQTPAL